ncbi:hypothetical protein [Desulfofustis glycolicus]|uniref:Uncharacterized protein n=1 Tax=Desulfofustis glycolicus DSM 9705 TaxID=1121409 RepID=A0A1M5WKG4_9BACT|nr:hypothetical protein [Desulfofustis glycolicus]MCB2217152.1 hypothetical protein [Desulfobulbaceae bacterium]SHH87918.1 hypothetical protein SAMN02745124_02360 [Desulfofustis glycolicus DSM 9705]
MEYKKALFMYRNKDYAVDGIRSALGLAVENMYSYGVVMDCEIEKLDEHNMESIEMLRDMEGEVYTTVPANQEKNGFELLTLEEVGEKLREMDIIIPYGLK